MSHEVLLLDTLAEMIPEDGDKADALPEDQSQDISENQWSQQKRCAPLSKERARIYDQLSKISNFNPRVLSDVKKLSRQTYIQEHNTTLLSSTGVLLDPRGSHNLILSPLFFFWSASNIALSALVALTFW